MNAQRQDILNILQSRGPLYTRELFDIMQDTYGYWGNVEASKGCECLSKVLWDMKSKGQLHSRKDNTSEGPKSLWGLAEFSTAGDERETSPSVNLPETVNPILGNLTSPGYIPDDEHAEMVSDITELSQPSDDDSRAIEYMKELDGGLQVLNTASVIRSSNGIEIITMKIYASDACYLNGEAVIRNRAELAQFIGAIERMLP